MLPQLNEWNPSVWQIWRKLQEHFMTSFCYPDPLLMLKEIWFPIPNNVFIMELAEHHSRTEETPIRDPLWKWPHLGCTFVYGSNRAKVCLTSVVAQKSYLWCMLSVYYNLSRKCLSIKWLCKCPSTSVFGLFLNEPSNCKIPVSYVCLSVYASFNPLYPTQREMRENFWIMFSLCKILICTQLLWIFKVCPSFLEAP